MKIRHNKNRKIKEPNAKTAAVYSVYINLLIYLLIVVMLIYGRSAVMPYVENPEPHPPLNALMLSFGLLSNYLYVFLLLWMNFLILKINTYSNAVRTTIAIAVSLVFIIFWNNLWHLVHTHVFQAPTNDDKAVRGAFFRDFVIGGVAVFTSMIMFVNYRRQLIMLENEALKAEYEHARFETLKSHIDPHFLFNALNTLNSVIVVDQEKAQRYVQKMSAIFRYTIQSRNVSVLEEELAFARDYCELMRLRYGDNLNFVFDIVPKYNYYAVMPFGVQTLIENAIKHNTIMDNKPLTVTISTDSDDFVVVSNPLQLKNEPEQGEGTGLNNLSERYRLRFGRDIEIYDNGSVFSVRLPLVRDTDNNKTVEK